MRVWFGELRLGLSGRMAARTGEPRRSGNKLGRRWRRPRPGSLLVRSVRRLFYVVVVVVARSRLIETNEVGGRGGAASAIGAEPPETDRRRLETQWNSDAGTTVSSAENQP